MNSSASTQDGPFGQQASVFLLYFDIFRSTISSGFPVVNIPAYLSLILFLFGFAVPAWGGDVVVVRDSSGAATVVSDPGPDLCSRTMGTAGFDEADRKKIVRMARMYGTMYGVEPALILAVAEAESGMDRHAVSPAGAEGVMQLMPGTARMLGVGSGLDLNGAMEGGVRYLRSLLDRFGEVPLALAAYNAGPGAVAKYDGIPPYEETRRYVEKVLALWSREQAEVRTDAQ